MVKGYKNTEVGVIPEDWDKSDITKVIDKTNGIKIGPFGSQLKKELLTNSGYKVYGQENVYNKNMEIGHRYISKEHFQKLNSCEIKAGDFLISMMGTIGKCIIVPEKFEAGIMDSHLIRLRLDKEKLSSELLLHFFSSQILNNQVKKFSVGGIMEGLSSKIVKQIQLPLPPTLTEQTAIATALNDADALIQKLEQLIDKKRLIKTGAMQELLKPKEGWEVDYLGNHISFQVGYPFSSIHFNQKGDGIRLVKNRDLKSDDMVFHYSGEFDNNFLINNGDVLISMDGEFISCLWNKGEALLNQRVGRLLAKKDVSTLFMYYYLQRPLKEIENRTSSTTVKHLSHGDIEGIIIPIPKPVEQARIAQILSDMDNEIEALEKQLEKYKKLKQGMMQNLLTGKIRLV